MTDYTKLVDGLRWCAEEAVCCDDINGEKCPYYDVSDSCTTDAVLHDAAAAIEALMDAEKTYLAELAQCHENLRRAAETRRERDERIEALQAEVKRLQDKLCDWCAVCPKERRKPEDCEMLSETPVMYGPSDAKMEVQE